jgi:exodeoxyribonuclease-5
MLNQSQLAAKTEILNWLVTPNEPELILSSPGGYGKSYLIDDIIATLPRLGHINNIDAIEQTATTNKAASILAKGQTVNKLFGLVPIKDYETGESYLKRKEDTLVFHNHFLLIDEASGAGAELVRHTREMSVGCKTLYSGDHCQLLPINEPTSPIFDAGLRQLTLTEPMRQDPNSDLFKLCQQLRETVETGIWLPMDAGKGITFANAAQSAKVFDEWFHPHMESHAAKVIAYENERVLELNAYVRNNLGFTRAFVEGDVVSIRNYCYDLGRKFTTTIETVFSISYIDTRVQDYKGMQFVHVGLTDGCQYRMPLDAPRFAQAIKQTARSKDWQTHYYLKEHFIDLRSAYSCTGHVSQGSTYDKVFIDLDNLGKCRDIKTLARLLYVAITRAKGEVVFNGQLPYKLRG